AIREVPTSAFSAVTEVSPESASTGSRQAYFRELGGMVDTPTYDHAKLETGAAIEGPAIVDAATTTVVVYPGHRLIADGRGSMMVEVPERSFSASSNGAGGAGAEVVA